MVEELLISCISTLYFILPAYLSNSGGLIFGGGRPVDFEKTDKSGKRWIGNGVTWRGIIGGTVLGTIVGAIQGYFGPTIIANFGAAITTPICANLVEGVITGFLLGFGALVGDAIGSFIKRRIGIERGQSAPLLDQLDFLIVALIFVSPLYKFSLTFIAIAVILTIIIHVASNSLAYLAGLKDTWN